MIECLPYKLKDAALLVFTEGMDSQRSCSGPGLCRENRLLEDTSGEERTEETFKPMEKTI